jgi:hypothetical protein
MHVFNRLPGFFFSSQVDLLGSRPVKTQSYIIRIDDDDVMMMMMISSGLPWLRSPWTS